jgi:hypothetical protein
MLDDFFKLFKENKTAVIIAAVIVIALFVLARKGSGTAQKISPVLESQP